MRRTHVLSLAFLALLMIPHRAWTQQEIEQARDLGSLPSGWPKAGPTCSGGVAVDDSSFENGYRIPFASDARFVQRLTPAAFPAIVNRVCACWQVGLDAAAMPFNFLIYDDDGPGGLPGHLLGSVPSAISIGTPFGEGSVGVDCANLGIRVDAGAVFIGVQWNAATNVDFFTCGDESTTTPPRVMYYSDNGGTSWATVASRFSDARALGLRAEFGAVPGDPAPPAGPWLTTPELPGFQFKAVIGGSRTATQVLDCVPETLCLAGAIADRTEVFVRIIGPRANGFLWPEVVRFTVAQVEVWVQKTTGGKINYYKLAGVPADSDVLNGLVDRDGFLP